MHQLHQLSNQALLLRLRELVACERQATAAVVCHLAEVERRGLHRDEGYESLFVYCRQALQLSENEAYLRIHACRVVRRFPLALERLQRGALHLSALKLLGPRLTEENHRQLLDAAAGKSKPQLQQLLAERFPEPDVPTVVRKLPSRALKQPSETPQPTLALSDPKPPAPAPAFSPPPTLRPAPPRPAARPTLAPLSALSAERFKLQLTVSRSLHDKLQQACELTRHGNPSGDLCVVIEQALQLLIEKQLKQHFAKVDRPRRTSREPRPDSRYLPAEVRREVAERDQMRCTYASDSGHRCQARTMLEYHHEQPYARGGAPTADNIRLLCRAHNQLMAERDFGPLFVHQRRAGSGASCQT